MYKEMRKTKKYTFLKAIFRYPLGNFVKLNNVKIIYKVLCKLQVVNKLSKEFYYKRQIKTNEHFDNMFTVNE